jgi:hypothetical protein
LTELTPQEAARGCLLRIVAQPGRYDQGTWQTVTVDDIEGFDQRGIAEVSCATTGCVAGTAAMLAGDVGIASQFDRTSRKGRDVYSISKVVTQAGRTIGIKDRGRQVLGLSATEANWLFEGHRSLPEVINALIELSEGQPLGFKHQSDMTNDEIAALKKYRVPRPVKRQSVPAKPAVPVQLNQSVPQQH